MTMVSTAKLASIGILFLLSSISGLLPYLVLRCVSRQSKSMFKFRKVLSLMNCFSGGVFFATSVLGLLPEARATMDEAFEQLGYSVEYPVTEVMMGVGFITILFIENIAITCCAEHKDTKISCETVPVCNKMDMASQVSSIHLSPVEHSSGIRSVVGEATMDTNNSDVNDQLPANRYGTIDEEHTHVTAEGITKLRGFILVMALSIHMIFEGMEVGLLDSENQVWSLLLALSVHKVLVFFSLGLTICESTSFVKSAAVMIIVSLVSPIGVSIGILVTTEGAGTATTTVSAFLQGFAVGTFIYVAFFEILLREFTTKDTGGILRAFSTFVGYTLFALLKYFVPE